MKQPGYYPLLIGFVKNTRLPNHFVIILITCIMLLFFVLMAYLGGAFSELSKWGIWRNFMDAPVSMIYILLMYPFLWRLLWRSVDDLNLLTPEDQDGSFHSEISVPLPNRRREWIALLAGAIFWLSLWQPWGWNERWVQGEVWLTVYEIVTQSLLFGLLSLLVYSSFTDSWYVNQLIRRRANPNIFNTDTLTPVARSSLGFSIAWLGGISLSLLFQTQKDLLRWENIIVWVILVCFAVLIFFLSMWSTHSTIIKVKKQELSFVQKYLKETSRELKESAQKGNLEKTAELSSIVTTWINYERRIKEVPEWPYNARIIRSLAASTIVPALVYLFKIISGLA